MASLLTPTEATEVVERLIRRVYPDREEDAWIDLVERSLGVPKGSLYAELRDPDESGAAEVVARLLAQVGE